MSAMLGAVFLINGFKYLIYQKKNRPYFFFFFFFGCATNLISRATFNVAESFLSIFFKRTYVFFSQHHSTSGACCCPFYTVPSWEMRKWQAYTSLHFTVLNDMGENALLSKSKNLKDKQNLPPLCALSQHHHLHLQIPPKGKANNLLNLHSHGTQYSSQDIYMGP